MKSTLKPGIGSLGRSGYEAQLSRSRSRKHTNTHTHTVECNHWRTPVGFTIERIIRKGCVSFLSLMVCAVSAPVQIAGHKTQSREKKMNKEREERNHWTVGCLNRVRLGNHLFFLWHQSAAVQVRAKHKSRKFSPFGQPRPKMNDMRIRSLLTRPSEKNEVG